MSFSSWRQFQFFDVQQLNDPLTSAKQPLFSEHSLSAIAPLTLQTSPENSYFKKYTNSDLLVVSYNSTRIKIISLVDSEILIDYNAYDEADPYKITHVRSLEHMSSVFLTVAECAGKPALIKVWKFGTHLKTPDAFLSLVEAKDKDHSNIFPISAMDTSPNLNCIAIGYANGVVVLIRGDIMRDRGYKQRVIYSDAKNEPITSLLLDSTATHLFVGTSSRIFTLSTSGRNNRELDLLLNDHGGVLLNCATQDEKKRFACLSEDSIDWYTSKGEKTSLALDIKNKTRFFFIDPMHYLIVTSVDTSSYTSKNFAQVSNFQILIVDVATRVVSMSTTVTSSIIDVFKFNYKKDSCVLILLGDGKFLRITEKNIKDQLAIVIQRELYPVALNLAEKHSSEINANQIPAIKKLYGDYLYKKGEKTKAMDQYIESLDVIEETSEIISKYSIAQSGSSDSVNDLSRFLWALLRNGCAHTDHITLLIITLVKLKDQKAINFFIDHYSRAGKLVDAADDYNYTFEEDEEYFYSDLELFDLKKVLRLLVEAGFKEEAYKLCRKFSKDPSSIVDILLNVLDDPRKALNYAKSLPVDDTLRVLLTYSKKLLDYLPNDVNALLIAVFTGVYKPEVYVTSRKAEEKQPKTSDMENFNSIVFHTYTSFFQYSSKINEEQKQTSLLSEPTYHPPRPSLIFTSFINKPYEFVVFLEACLEAYNKFKGFDSDKQDVLTNLYDVYLSLNKNDEVVERRESWKQKAIQIYKNVEATETFEPDNSLMLLISDLHKFSVEKDDLDKNEITSLFRQMTLNSSAETVMQFLKKHGEQEPELYSIALKYCISSKTILEKIGGEDVIKKDILAPMMQAGTIDMLHIIELLSSTTVTTFGLIKDMLINHIQEESHSLDTNKKLLHSYKDELEKVNNELKGLLTENDPVEIKLDREVCSICQTALELPVVYFKCGHSYHQKCLSEEDFETLKNGEAVYRCPQCIVELETAKKLASAQAEFAQQQNREFELAVPLSLQDATTSASGTSTNEKFISHIKKRLSEIFNININSTEFWSTIKNSLTFQKFSTFEIAEILQPCFEKFRNLYDSYALYHEKQLFFLNFIKQHKNTKKLAEKWFSGCDCEYELEYLLKLPIERILGWPVFLEKLIKCGKHMLYSDSLAALSDFQYEYKLYVRSFSAKLYQHRKEEEEEEEEEELTSVKTSSILSLSSKTSSIYSSYCPSSKDETIDMGLQEQKERFKRVYHNMEKLKTLLQKLDLLFFVKSLYGIASKWQSFVELFDKEESSSRVNSLNNNANSMHGKYIEKLERQLLAVSRLQNNEISHNLVKNLNQILGYCNKVQKVINNHHQLEKEQKRLAQKDVKYDAIMKQELYLQTALVENLPLFLQYCDSFANALTLRYCKIILSYLEIMSGGAFFLQKETESSKKGKRDLGDNFDILQLYTSNRFLTKNAVMDTCFEKDKYICSKVFRKLFN
ncbi:hypothetical protein ACO0QE_003380 [Hanseniaspora vineae]